MTQPIEVVVSDDIEVVEVRPAPMVLEVTLPGAPIVIERAYDKALGTTKGDPGQQGPAGAPGPPGPQGGPAAPITYTQMTPSTLWQWTHPFPYRPDVDVFDPDGEQLMSVVLHPAPGLVHVRHDIPMTGTTTIR